MLVLNQAAERGTWAPSVVPGRTAEFFSWSVHQGSVAAVFDSGSLSTLPQAAFWLKRWRRRERCCLLIPGQGVEGASTLCWEGHGLPSLFSGRCPMYQRISTGSALLFAAASSRVMESQKGTERIQFL